MYYPLRNPVSYPILSVLSELFQDLLQLMKIKRFKWNVQRKIFFVVPEESNWLENVSVRFCHVPCYSMNSTSSSIYFCYIRSLRTTCMLS